MTLMFDSLRFEYLVQANIQSVRECDPSRLYSHIDTRPHYVVRRYAEYTSAISAIHGKQFICQMSGPL